jgi:hypothetical protein
MALFVLAFAGLGRSALFGIEQAAASRYVHVVGVLLVIGLGAAFFASQHSGASVAAGSPRSSWLQLL